MAAIHFRILGYASTILLHVTNLTVLQLTRKEELSADLKIVVFRSMLYRYFTCWTIGLQILYAVLGLYCDVLTLQNSKKNYSLWKPVRRLRNVMFGALVWPCTMVVFTVFWSLFLYDRSLIYPEFIDQVISSTSNHILHTAIVPIAVWEILFRPRVKPRSHAKYLAHLAALLVAYLFVLYSTYNTYGLWLYPIFHVTYGTIHFITVHLCMGILFLTFYYMQWWLNYIVHGDQVDTKKIK